MIFYLSCFKHYEILYEIDEGALGERYGSKRVGCRDAARSRKRGKFHIVRTRAHYFTSNVPV
jgi:hypothetical protein